MLLESCRCCRIPKSSIFTLCKYKWSYFIQVLIIPIHFCWGMRHDVMLMRYAEMVIQLEFMIFEHFKIIQTWASCILANVMSPTRGSLNLTYFRFCDMCYPKVMILVLVGSAKLFLIIYEPASVAIAPPRECPEILLGFSPKFLLLTCKSEFVIRILMFQRREPIFHSTVPNLQFCKLLRIWWHFWWNSSSKTVRKNVRKVWEPEEFSFWKCVILPRRIHRWNIWQRFRQLPKLTEILYIFTQETFSTE